MIVMKLSQFVAHVQVNVKLVILMETVLNVNQTEKTSQLVNVSLTISKPSDKEKCFVKSVMSDVMNVLMFSTCVNLVLMILTELLLQNVNVQKDI
jgi:hypothetical protein